MSAVKITASNFAAEVKGSEKPVLLDFWASWCGPCRMVSPVVDEIAAERPDILVGKVNVDKEPELASAFNISSIPTLVVMRGGEIVNRATGARPKSSILSRPSLIPIPLHPFFLSKTEAPEQKLRGLGLTLRKAPRIPPGRGRFP